MIGSPARLTAAGLSPVRRVSTTSPGYVLLLTATLLTSAFGLILKSAQHTRRNPVAVGCINYIVAGMAGGVALTYHGLALLDPATVIIGALTGVFYVVSFWFLVIAMKQSGIAVTMAIVRLSVLVPILCSIFIWYEIPTPGQTIGIVCVCVALPFLSVGIGGKGAAALGSTAWLIAALFTATGACYLSPKLFTELAPPGQVLTYVSCLFGTAGLVSLFLIRRMRIPIHRRDYGHGILQGFCNLAGTYTIALALTYLPGTIVFPFASAAGLVMTTAAAVMIWGEHIRKPAYIGIGFTLIALVLINGK